MQRKSAFTLVELLVVIAIVSLLAAMLLPVLAQARKSATDTVCLSNQKQLGILIHQYIGENEGYFPRHPDGFYPGTSTNWYEWRKGESWIWVIKRTIAPDLVLLPPGPIYRHTPHTSIAVCPSTWNGLWASPVGGSFTIFNVYMGAMAAPTKAMFIGAARPATRQPRISVIIAASRAAAGAARYCARLSPCFSKPG